jgi:hypothetical protein
VVVATVSGSDPQSLPVTYTYVWKVNGTVVKTTSSTSATTDSLNLNAVAGVLAGQTVTVTVTPNNGVVDGSPSTSNTLNVTA